jgi:aminopeptidase N
MVFSKQNILVFLFFIIGLSISKAQIKTFTHQDSLRGSITPERDWWDLKAYRLHIQPNPEDNTVKGMNRIVFEQISSPKRMQIDLQEPMQIDSVLYKKGNLEYQREGNVYWLTFKNPMQGLDSIDIYFSGKPKISSNPPWDGGLTWTKDSNGKDFYTTSVQGEGASLWWPCKDHMYDEVEEMDIFLTTAKDLKGIANGRLTETISEGEQKTYHWQVKNPINNYGVNMNVGNYVNFSEIYQGLNGPLTCNYYVLEENKAKAEEQFKQVSQMLEAFEYWFGPYPFYEDSFKLVEVPYLGMEHQSSVTYGNNYQNGYRGRDLSGTGWGLKFDFIIIHESGHEWFANNITNKDIADMWIHESFTAYSESLFLEYYYGKKAGQEYVRGTRKNILNDRPIIGTYHVNQSGSGDMYYKGANMLNTLRTQLNNDTLWREILIGLNKKFYHRTVNTEEIESFLCSKSKLDLNVFFDQYLRTTKVPVLEYQIEENTLSYRYTNALDGFNLPIVLEINGIKTEIAPKKDWTSRSIQEPIKAIDFDPNYFVKYLKIN